MDGFCPTKVNFLLILLGVVMKLYMIFIALIKLFTLVGLPESVQSDKDSNFMSGVFQQVNVCPLSIKRVKEPSNIQEHAKNMFCHQTGKDWDEGVHHLLFSARDSVQESLGFSPFELVFGHSI